MGSDSEVIDSPVGWVNKHIRNYVESGGANGQKFYGVDSLLITTRGRKTGRLHRTALYYGRDGERFVVVGSNGGQNHHPQWALNLQETPEIEVQVGEEVFPATARLADSDERPRLWQMMAAIFPKYLQYEKTAAREIPVVVIERTCAVRR